MKKFSERSERGQRRIMICSAGAVCIVLIVLALLSGGTKSPIEELLGDGKASPVPTKLPTITPVVTVTNVPTPIIGGVQYEENEIANLDVMIRWIMEYVLNPSYPYGSRALNGETIEAASFGKVCGIEAYGEQITADKVGAGDIGIYGTSVCICIGMDNDGNAVFAYANPYSSELLPNGGVYLGYSMEQKDALFYGMYPVPCEMYYDCFDGSADISLAVEKAVSYSKSISIYAEPIFGMGRIFSKKMADAVMELVPRELLLEHNVRFIPEELETFLDSFVIHAGAGELSDCDYCFREKKRFFLSGGSYIKAELVSLSPDNFLACKGEWTLSIGEQALIPFIDFKLDSYIGWGFAKAQQTEFVYDESGTLLGYEISEITDDKGKISVNNDGNSVYTDSSYSITLEPGESFVEEELCIIDRGNWQYLLVANGSSYECDMSEYSEKGEQYIRDLLDVILQNMIENTEEEEWIEE